MKKKQYAAHRRSLMARLSDGLILLSGGREIPRNNDVHFVFRQKSNFLYLTGVEEPGYHLLLDPKRRRETLFIPRIDHHHRIWEGHVPGPSEARRLFGIGQVLYFDKLPLAVAKAAKGYRCVYADPAAWRSSKLSLDGLPNAPEKLEDALWELRAVKTAGERVLLKHANKVSARAHRAVMAAARPGLREYQIQAVFEAECLRAGLRHLAYPSIVASGRNAAVLHYHRNAAPLRKGDLLLIDAGAEDKGYAADITRTFPVSGRFTTRQRDVYSIVLETQKRCIARSRPGITSAELHVFSMRQIAEGLKSLGILTGDTDGLIQGGAVRLFYPHGIGHLLGLDAHDGFGGKRRKLPNTTGVPVRFIARLEPGFAMTVEPGIYFIEALLHDPRLRRKHRGSVNFQRAESFLGLGGIRIEDDVVIQKKGPPLNLTKVPKEIDDVEDALR